MSKSTPLPDSEQYRTRLTVRTPSGHSDAALVHAGLGGSLVRAVHMMRHAHT